jgi:hypothetical protein
MGVDFFTGTVDRPFFQRFQFDRLTVTDGQGLRRLWLIEDTQSVLSVFVTGYLDEFVEDSRLLFPPGFSVAGTDLPGDCLFLFHS